MLDPLFPIALGMLGSLLDEGLDLKRPFSPPSEPRVLPELSETRNPLDIGHNTHRTVRDDDNSPSSRRSVGEPASDSTSNACSVIRTRR